MNRAQIEKLTAEIFLAVEDFTKQKVAAELERRGLRIGALEAQLAQQASVIEENGRLLTLLLNEQGATIAEIQPRVREIVERHLSELGR